MKLYKEGGLTVYCPKEINLDRDRTAVLSKRGTDALHMDIYRNGKGPTGVSVDFGVELLDGVLELFR